MPYDEGGEKNYQLKIPGHGHYYIRYMHSRMYACIYIYIIDSSPHHIAMSFI
jgi:hypothetical protein